MEPALREGDKVTVYSRPQYEIGDILVFSYKENALIIHRLLKMEKDRYFCKGDNSYRLEDITYDQILGRVEYINDNVVLGCSKNMVLLSYMVGREFRNQGYNREKTKKTAIYHFYKNYVTDSDFANMEYRCSTINDAFEQNGLSDSNLLVNNSYTDFISKRDVLECLKEPCDLRELLTRLKTKDITPYSDLRRAIVEILAELIVHKRVLVILMDDKGKQDRNMTWYMGIKL